MESHMQMRANWKKKDREINGSEFYLTNICECAYKLGKIGNTAIPKRMRKKTPTTHTEVDDEKKTERNENKRIY